MLSIGEEENETFNMLTFITNNVTKKVLVKVGLLYSAAYSMTGPAHFTISKVAVDWQEPMLLLRKLRPSNYTR